MENKVIKMVDRANRYRMQVETSEEEKEKLSSLRGYQKTLKDMSVKERERDYNKRGITYTKRDRDYTGRDLWLFYLSLKPDELLGIRAKKGKAQKTDIKSIQDGIFNALFNNGQYPFRVIGVKDGGYESVNIQGTNHQEVIEKAYSTLTRLAKEEVLSEHKGLGKDAVGLDLTISKGGSNELKNDFEKSIGGIFDFVLKQTGGELKADSILTSNRVASLVNKIKSNPNVSKRVYETLREAIVQALFKTGSISASDQAAFKNLKEVDRIIDILLSTNRRQDIQKEIGLFSEIVVGQLLTFYANAKESALSEAKKMILKKAEQTGQISQSTTYKNIEKKKKITTRPFYITPDIKLEFEELDVNTGEVKSKSLNISLKTPSNMNKIIYKSSQSRSGDVWTKIANWNKVLQTYAGFSVFHSAANLRFKLYQIFAAGLSSLAIAGTAEERALITVAMSGGQITIKSLDTILEGMKKSQEARLRMNEIRIANRAAYIHNARRIASGRVVDPETGSKVSTLDPRYISEEIYQKYSDLKDLRLNYILTTRPKSVNTKGKKGV